jgi:hypothetical protein
MNDLSGLDWDNKPSSVPPRVTPQYNITRPVQPISRGLTPLPLQQSGPGATPGSGPRPIKPVGEDSFASLLGTSASKKPSSLSLQERQKQLLQEKARQGTSQSGRPGLGTQYASDESFWEGLGSGRNTPAQGGLPAPIALPGVRMRSRYAEGTVRRLIQYIGYQELFNSEER